MDPKQQRLGTVGPKRKQGFSVWAPQADVRNGFGDATRYALKRSRDTPLTTAVTEIPIRRVALAPGSGHLPRCPLPRKLDDRNRSLAVTCGRPLSARGGHLTGATRRPEAAVRSMTVKGAARHDAESSERKRSWCVSENFTPAHWCDAHRSASKALY